MLPAIKSKTTFKYKNENEPEQGATSQNETEEQKSLRRAERSAKQQRPLVWHEEDFPETDNEAESPGNQLIEEPGYIESLFPTPDYPVTKKEEQIDMAIQRAARAEKRQRMRWISGWISLGVFILILVIALPITCTSARNT